VNGPLSNAFVATRDIGLLLAGWDSWRPEAGNGQIRTTGTEFDQILSSGIYHW
jgi:hypothetical protein